MICPICCRASASSSKDWKGNGLQLQRRGGRGRNQRGSGGEDGGGSHGCRSRSLLEEFSEQLGVKKKKDDVRLLVNDDGSRSPRQDWTFCSECLPIVERVVEGRRRCLKVEQQVNTLQLRIMEELRCLRKGMTQFYLDLKEVEGLARRGVGSGDPLEQEEGPMDTDTDCENNSLRNRISEALNELQDYQTELGTKLLASPEPEIKNEGDDPLSMSLDEIDEPEPFKPGSNDGIVFMEEEGSGSTPSDLKSALVGSSFEDIGYEGRSFDLDLDDYGEDDVKQLEFDSDKDNDYSPNVDDDPDTEDDGISSSSLADSQGNLDDYEDDDDDDYKGAPPPPKKARSKRSRSTGVRSDISKISSLKEMFILKAESGQGERTPKRVQKRKGPGRKRCTDLDSKIALLKYNPETGKLTVGDDIELIIEEESKTVQCGSCSFQVSWSEAESSFKGSPSKAQVLTKLTRGISDHINGVHLGTFDCSICPMKKSTRHLYVMHMNRCHGGGRFPCDICGKTFPTNQSLIVHRWSHMNEEERNEAIRKGLKGPVKHQLRQRDKQTRTQFRCRICQKVLKSKYSLQEHEKLHSGSNDFVICPNCGKSLTKRSYDTYHKIFKCPLNLNGDPREEELPKSRVKCPHCPKTLKNKFNLRDHIKSCHPPQEEVGSQLCSVCGKAYNTKRDLQKHFKTKHGEKTKCRWGCGKEFRWEPTCTKHELICRSRNDHANSKDSDSTREEGLHEHEEN